MIAEPSIRLCLVERGCLDVARALFPRAELIDLTWAELRPRAPFEGPLFEALEAAADCLPDVPTGGGPPGRGAAGLVVPGVWIGVRPRPPLLPVADHVDLVRHGPLTGRWPAGRPRSFPCMTGIYQPRLVRRERAASLYSAGVTAAGVADAGALSPFERRAVDGGDYPVLTDCLVPAAVVAAYYGVNLAAGVVPASS